MVVQQIGLLSPHLGSEELQAPGKTTQFPNFSQYFLFNKFLLNARYIFICFLFTLNIQVVLFND